jgi:hypothetical protein
MPHAKPILEAPFMARRYADCSCSARRLTDAPCFFIRRNLFDGVAAESEDYFRSSEIALEGDQDPRTVIFEFRGVPGGHYEIRGVVGDAGGHEVATAQQSAFVWSSGGER